MPGEIQRMDARLSFSCQTKSNWVTIQVMDASTYVICIPIHIFRVLVLFLDLWWQNVSIPHFSLIGTMEKWQQFISRSKLPQFTWYHIWTLFMAYGVQIWRLFWKLTASSLIIHKWWQAVKHASKRVRGVYKTMSRVFQGWRIQKWGSFWKLTTSSLIIHEWWQGVKEASNGVVTPYPTDLKS